VRPLLAGLDREQRRAVTHGDGPLLVVAGPGTGKTEVITRRIAWLIATKRADPSEILALTFTDKAANEMQARVDVLVPYGRADAAIHTFHAFGDRLIREYGHELGLDPLARVIARSEAVVLLREHLFELGLERYRPLSDPTRFLDALVDLFQRAKDEGVGPDELSAYARELSAGAEAVGHGASSEGERAVAAQLADEAAAQAELAGAYDRYQQLLAERSLLDFGDQVSIALRLLRERPAVAGEVAARFRYVLVDELQDTNPIQLQFVRELAGYRNLTAVGDDDQAIYAFRGAAVHNLLSLGVAYPDLRQVVLRRNYRSRAPILAAARRLILHNDPARLESRAGLNKELVARRRGRSPAPVRHLGFRRESEEADAVAAEIATRIEQGESPADFAVLVRTNGDATRFEERLLSRGVAVRSGGVAGLLAHQETRELVALLRAIVEPGSSTDLYVVATGAPYGLAGAELTAILEMARRRHLPLWSVLGDLVEQPGLLRLSPETRHQASRLVADLRAAIEDSHRRPATDVLYRHLRRSGRYQALVSAAGDGDDGPLRRVARLFDWVRSHALLVADPRVAVLVPHLRALLEAAGDPAADDDPTTDAVSVLTVHKAKGLEFPVVYLAGLAEGRFPVRGRRDRLALPEALRHRETIDEDPLAEERRLCYVAMTRARDELVLTYAAEAGAGGRRRRPSPFLAEALDHELAPVRGSEATLALGLEPSDRTPETRKTPSSSTTGPLSLSYSQVDDYLSCPLKYRLRHQLGVPTPPHHALVLGNALHQAVAAYHLAGLRGRRLDEAGVLEAFNAHWTSEGFLSRRHEEARFQSGQDALRRFVATPAEDGRTVVAVERSFSVRIGPDTVRGRFDRVDTSPEGAVITDYKSSDVREPRRAAEKARDSLQLQLYALAWQAETGELPAAVELHFLESGLVGRVTPDEARLDRAKRALGEAAEGIRSGRFTPRPTPIACGYCPYREICPSSAA
jgi:DNA helicase-2/ATP-dependent DNA helicase PcrA